MNLGWKAVRSEEAEFPGAAGGFAPDADVAGYRLLEPLGAKL